MKGTESRLQWWTESNGDLAIKKVKDERTDSTIEKHGGNREIVDDRAGVKTASVANTHSFIVSLVIFAIFIKASTPGDR